MTTLIEAAQQALEALIAVEALIEHQYTGTRDGMTAFQDASDDAHLAIEPLRKAIEQAERQSTHSEGCYKWHHACAIARIEQAEKPEPVAWMTFTAYGDEDDIWYENPEGKVLEGWTYIPLYTSPPPRQPLTDEEINRLWVASETNISWNNFEIVAREIEAAHGIKGEA